VKYYDFLKILFAPFVVLPNENYDGKQMTAQL